MDTSGLKKDNQINFSHSQTSETQTNASKTKKNINIVTKYSRAKQTMR